MLEGNVRITIELNNEKNPEEGLVEEEFNDRLKQFLHTPLSIDLPILNLTNKLL